MNDTIWKFPLVFDHDNLIEISHRNHFVSVGLDPADNLCCVWYQHCPDSTSKVRYVLRIFGTGWDMEPHLWQPLGSVMQGPYVWHVMMRQVP